MKMRGRLYLKLFVGLADQPFGRFQQDQCSTGTIDNCVRGSGEIGPRQMDLETTVLYAVATLTVVTVAFMVWDLIRNK
jgi:hypothetical protein